jgi:hypothetical protein
MDIYVQLGTFFRGQLFIKHSDGFTLNSTLTTPVSSPAGAVAATDALSILSNVGIGTSSPAEKLHINGNATFGDTDRLTLIPDLSVFAAGVSTLRLTCTGVSRPKLEVKNTLTSSRPGAFVNADDTQTSQSISMGAGGTPNASTDQPHINVISNHSLDIMTNDTTRMRITSDGNVGIGTSSPSSGKLHVNGTSNGFGLRVNNNVYVGSGTVTTGRQDANYPITAQKDGDAFIRVSSGNNGGNAGVQFYGAGDRGSIYGTSGYEIHIEPNAQYGQADIIMAPKNGSTMNVGIGTNNPTAKLDVRGDVLSYQNGFYVEMFSNGASDRAGIEWLSPGSMGVVADGNVSFIETDANVVRATFNLNSNTFRFGDATDPSTNQTLQVAGTALVTGTLTVNDDIVVKSDITYTSPDSTNTIVQRMTDADVLSWSGDAGQLFSLSDSLTGTIFSVNDVSGVPSIEVDDDGTIRLAETFGNVLIGTTIDNGNKLQVTGNVAINTTGVASAPSLAIDNTSTSTFIHSIEALGANMTANQTNLIVVGKEGSTKNSGYIGYNWAGAASDSNYVSIGHWGSDHLFRVYANGNITAGTNTIWHAGNDGTGSGLDADTVDSIQASSFLRSDAADTATGQIFFDAGFDAHPIMLSGAQNFDNIDRSGFYNLYSTQTGSTNSPSMDFGTMIVVGNDKQSQGFGLQLAHERLNNGMFVRGMNDTASAWSSWQRIFMDNYHPNADTWTTARTATVTLTGDATGTAGVSVDGSANWTNSIAVTVDRIDGQQFVNTRSNSGRAANSTDGNGLYYYTSDVDNFTGNSTDGAMYQQSYSTSWYHQIAGDYRSGNIALRGKNNNTWQRWKKVPTIYTSDTAPTTALVNDDFWFDSDEGKLKIRYNGVWMDTFTLGTSNFVQKSGDTMTGNLNVQGNILATGDVTAYGTISDIRQKENIVKLDNAIEKVGKLSGYTFNYIGHEDRLTGVIAQEVYEVLPEAVYETESLDSQETIMAVRHGNMVGLLIEAIKEQQEQINELKAEIEKLKGK